MLLAVIIADPINIVKVISGENAAAMAKACNLLRGLVCLDGMLVLDSLKMVDFWRSVPTRQAREVKRINGMNVAERLANRDDSPANSHRLQVDSCFLFISGNATFSKIRHASRPPIP